MSISEAPLPPVRSISRSSSRNLTRSSYRRARQLPASGRDLLSVSGGLFSEVSQVLLFGRQRLGLATRPARPCRRAGERGPTTWPADRQRERCRHDRATHRAGAEEGRRPRTDWAKLCGAGARPLWRCRLRRPRPEQPVERCRRRAADFPSVERRADSRVAKPPGSDPRRRGPKDQRVLRR